MEAPSLVMGPGGLVKGFEATPLQDFTARLEKVEPALQQGDRGSYYRIGLAFTEVVVHKSSSPYPHPIAQFSLPYSDRENSQWGILMSSVGRLGLQSIYELVGRMQRWALTSGHKVRRPNDAGVWGETEIDAFEVVEAEGVLSASAPSAPQVNPEELALMLADGKNIEQATSAILANPVIQADQRLGSMLLAEGNNNWFGVQLRAGKLTIDQAGVLHKVVLVKA